MKNFNFTTHRKLRKALVSVFLLAGIFMGNAQNILFLDSNFKTALLNHSPVIDTNGDGEITVREAEVFKGTMNIKDKDISNVLGLSYFTNLTGLDCSKNNLTSLDITNNRALITLDCSINNLTSLNLNNNTALEVLICYNNSLTNLDVSNNPALEYLICGDNNLTSLDVSNNPALETLYCHNNNLTSLDISNNPALEALGCYLNNLTSLDVSSNPALEYLACAQNNLMSLDVSKNPLLVSLYCGDNNLTSLDVSNNSALVLLGFDSNNLTSLDVSNNPALKELHCYENELTSLDVSNNPALKELYCYENELTSLNLANGNNAALLIMRAQDNDLLCIQIDDGFTPPSNWLKDTETEYSADCVLAVEDYQIQAVSVYPNPAQDRVFFQSAEAIQKITLYDFSGSKIKEFSPNSSKAEINVSGLSAGVYLAEIRTAKGSRTVKVVKK